MALFNLSKKNRYTFDGDDVEGTDFDPYMDPEETEEADEFVQTPMTPAEPVTPPAPSFNANPVALKIIAPKAYEDAAKITDYLMNGNTILLNLDSTEREIIIRLVDYLKGAVQVLGGMITKVGKTTLVVAPKNVDVSSIEAMVGNTAE